MAIEYARVYLLDAPFSIDKAYDYYIPVLLRNEVFPGRFVTIPFGNGNRPKLAVIASLAETTEVKQAKPILEMVSAEISLNEKMLRLALFMKEQTLCTVGEAIRAMVPTAALSRLIEYFRPSSTPQEDKQKNLSVEALFVLEYIKERELVSLDTLKNHFGSKCTEALVTLSEAKLIEKELLLRDSAVKKTEAAFSVAPEFLPHLAALTAGEKVGELRLTSKKHKAIAACFQGTEALNATEIRVRCGTRESLAPQIRALCEKGLLVRTERKVSQLISIEATEEAGPPLCLNPQQTEAFHTLKQLADTGVPKAALLLGVTGSGKTSVIMKMIDTVLQNGKGVIMLVPEIALTPQSIAIFHARYGARVAVIHSGLSAKERFNAYMWIYRGEADVVLGTRSAVFAPVKRLGMIVIDEEQEHTYKSDMNPKYHARDIARRRCADDNALMLLSSATPSLESYRKALEGKYTLVRLTERYGKAVLPDVIIADMRREAGAGNSSPLGALLTAKLIENQKAHGQSVLFINRRGYNNYVSCQSCGQAISCPKCSVSMTYHTVRGSYDEGYLVCHWCGTRKPYPAVCPTCGSKHLTRMGYGTQRIEQELTELMNGTGARILRMDTDTTHTKDAYDRLLGAFRRHEADILLGTQMVTKGHDFPDVTLVGVLLADASLYLDDYRAAERTFALLTQVIGRAGRADRPGLAIIQTNNPDSDVIRLACDQDYESFANRELKLRQMLVFPPFCDIVLITLASPDEKELMLASRQLSEMLRRFRSNEFSDVAAVIFGPFEAPVYRVDGKYRMRMVIKCRLNKRSRLMFASILAEFSKWSARRTTLSIDFNPSSL